MLAIQNKQLNSIFERIVKDKNGLLLRVRFTVVEIDGKFQAQIISAVPFITSADTESENTQNVVCLPCIKESIVVAETSVAKFESILSPYFFLEFFMSQPTRAPAFVF